MTLAHAYRSLFRASFVFLLLIYPIFSVKAEKGPNNGIKLLKGLSSEGYRSHPVSIRVKTLDHAARRFVPLKERVDAHSEKIPSYILGASPYELATQGTVYSRPQVNEQLKASGESFLANIASALKQTSFEVEMWPARNASGKDTWVIARYRSTPTAAWNWLDTSLLLLQPKGSGVSPLDSEPILPRSMDPQNNPQDHKKVFLKYLENERLYDKPLASNVLWTTLDGNTSLCAWLGSAHTAALESTLAEQPKMLARVLPQPAVFNQKPKTFTVLYSNAATTWPSDIHWEPVQPSKPQSLHLERRISNWDAAFKDKYMSDVTLLAGDSFTKKNSVQPDNELGKLDDYLTGRYASLGINTKRIDFLWHDMPQTILMAVIPGSLDGAKNRPILLADHIDTAFEEDTYAKSRTLQAAHGANDNVTAVATLLRAAETLKDSRPLHDIWLTHLSGEEYPADSLGARQLASVLIRDRKRIGGIVVLDMIGHRSGGSLGFQINSGRSERSYYLASVAFDASREICPELEPVFRSYEDKLSYLYNTDGIVFSDAGFPVILMNEMLNRTNMFDRGDYHTSKDDKLDDTGCDYAVSIAKVAIETVARLSQTDPQ